MISNNIVSIFAGLLMVTGVCVDTVAATKLDTSNEIKTRYRTMHPEICRRMENISPPDEIQDPIEFYERRYIDIDGDGVCEVVDVWIDRVTQNFDDYRLDNYSAIYKYRKGGWKKIPKNEGNFDYFPIYQIQDIKSKRIYYLFDFHYRGEAPVYIDAHGIKYFDKWSNEEIFDKSVDTARHGIVDCGYSSGWTGSEGHENFECDGQSFREIMRALEQE